MRGFATHRQSRSFSLFGIAALLLLWYCLIAPPAGAASAPQGGGAQQAFKFGQGGTPVGAGPRLGAFLKNLRSGDIFPGADRIGPPEGKPAVARAYTGDESTVPGRMRALGLDEREALGAVGAFVLTGTETIVSFVPRLAAILIDSGWLPRLAADRSLVDAAVAEALRVTTPTPVMLRSTVAPRRIGRVAARPGDRIVLATFAANRALGEFDPVGDPASSLKQLWFGAGAHYCLGAPLAMAQVRRTLDVLLERPAARIGERTAARGVLIPSYARLVLETA